MQTLVQLTQRSADYIRNYQEWGGTFEGDQSINEISRQKIQAMFEEMGECWLVKINLYGGDRGQRDPICIQYVGQQICNFQYDCCTPIKDNILIDLILTRDVSEYTGTADDMKRIDEIDNRIYAIGGVSLIWV